MLENISSRLESLTPAPKLRIGAVSRLATAAVVNPLRCMGLNLND